jgi:hypothetical protein
LGSGTRDEWEESAKRGAIAEWNRRAAPVQPAEPESIHKKINRRSAEALLDKLMAMCELIGYEKAKDELAATAQPAPRPLTERVFRLAELHKDRADDCGRLARVILAAAQEPKP